jgi:hypothetical protein
MPPNQSTAARQAPDHHALAGTITAIGRDHDGLRHTLARVNHIGLHREYRYLGPTNKMAIYLPCWKDIDRPELARLFFKHVICKRGVPDNIVTDRGTQFTG